MDQPTMTAEDVADLADRVRDSAAALIRGDVDRYLDLIAHSDDYTLMAPFGGETRRRFGSVAEARGFFTGPGEAFVDIEQSYTSGDLAVLVAVERQTGELGGLPAQDWSLRVTLVFRRVGTGWELVHRHADPLVRPITLAQLAQLAGGTA